MSGRRGSRKAWTRIPEYGTVKIDIHENPIQVASVDVRETVERANVAQEGTQLALTLKGLALPSRLLKLSKDQDRAIWLANSLAEKRFQKLRSDVISSQQRENWARRLVHAQNEELLDSLRQVGYECWSCGAVFGT